MTQIWILRVANKCFFNLLTDSRQRIDAARSRKIACYLDNAEAIRDVKNNVNDIAEGGTNPYAVIYPLAEGVPFAFCEEFEKEVWFQYDQTTDKYKEIDSPPTDKRQVVLD